MSVDDRKKLTSEEAGELISRYVSYFWPQYRSGMVSGYDKEDASADIYMKLADSHVNSAQDLNWKPGDPVKVPAWISDDGGKHKGVSNIDTKYMLEPGYNPNDPYDPNYFIMKLPHYNYFDKYDGRRTSKAYYIQSIVRANLIIMAAKKDASKYALELDKPVDSDDDGSIDNSNFVAAEDDVPDYVNKEELKDIIQDVINSLSNGYTGHERSGAIGYSPLTGEKDSNGNKIETAFTDRDAAMHLLYGYSPEEVASFYHRVDNGKPISVSSVSARYSTVKKKIKERLCDLPLSKLKVLQSYGFKLDDKELGLNVDDDSTDKDIPDNGNLAPISL